MLITTQFFSFCTCSAEECTCSAAGVRPRSRHQPRRARTSSSCSARRAACCSGTTADSMDDCLCNAGYVASIDGDEACAACLQNTLTITQGSPSCLSCPEHTNEILMIVINWMMCYHQLLWGLMFLLATCIFDAAAARPQSRLSASIPMLTCALASPACRPSSSVHLAASFQPSNETVQPLKNFFHVTSSPPASPPLP